LTIRLFTLDEVSKTERALTSDEVDAAGELEDLDPADEAADVDDDLDVGGNGALVVDDDDDVGGNGALVVDDDDDADVVDDHETTAENWAEVDEAVDEYVAVDDDDHEAAVVDGGDVDSTSDDEVEVADGDDVADAVSVEAIDDETASQALAGTDGNVADSSGGVALGDGEPDASDGVTDVADAVVVAPGADDEADAELDDGEKEPYEIPEIVPATPEPGEAREADDDDEAEEASDDILEELRRADIDGPIVEMAPQDDTTSRRRRPKRAPDYDPAPVPIPADVPRVLGRKPRVRKVTRVVRHVDPWSVFKIAIIANLVLYLVVLTAGVLLWNVAHATGTVDNVERFFESFGWNSFEFNGGEIYHAAWIAGLFVVIGLTGLAVLLATLFNLITDLVGGVRLTVLEEEVVETRTSPMRRFVVRRAEPDVPVTLRDESGAMVREAVVDDSGAINRPTR
jgi:hypothetical protein